MKIWIDILTPKQLLFFEPMILRLKKNHTVFCTTRRYSEVTNLAKIRKIKLNSIGKHGGSAKSSKLISSIARMRDISKIITKFLPDYTISFCSPEAARVSYGLGIRHLAFSDSPHANAVMKLSLPYVQKLLIPWIIPKREFVRFGIDAKNIIQYKAIDASSIVNRKTKKTKLPFDVKKNTILVRIEEEQAAYTSKSSRIDKILAQLIKDFEGVNIVVLARYKPQIKRLRKLFGSKIQILKMSYDGKLLLENSDVFIGSGGTMTAESALLGVPTISYNAVPNLIENYLVGKKIVKREANPNNVSKAVSRILNNSGVDTKKRAKKLISEMEDPYKKLISAMKSL